MFNRVFHYFHHPFWGVLPLFLVQHPDMFLIRNDLISKLQVSNRLAQDVPDMAVAAERLLGSPYSEICWFLGRVETQNWRFRFFFVAKITMGFLVFPYL